MCRIGRKAMCNELDGSCQDVYSICMLGNGAMSGYVCKESEWYLLICMCRLDRWVMSR